MLHAYCSADNLLLHGCAWQGKVPAAATTDTSAAPKNPVPPNTKKPPGPWTTGGEQKVCLRARRQLSRALRPCHAFVTTCQLQAVLQLLWSSLASNTMKQETRAVQPVAAYDRQCQSEGSRASHGQGTCSNSYPVNHAPPKPGVSIVTALTGMPIFCRDAVTAVQ